MKIRTVALALAAAAVTASSALAAGEPKNTPPFTRAVVAERAPAVTLTVRHAATEASISGEAKNQAPFTRPASLGVASGHLVLTRSAGAAPPMGEPKSEAPFTNSAGEQRSLALALRAAKQLVAAEAAGKPASAPVFGRRSPAAQAAASGRVESFNWADAGLVALAACCGCLAALGTIAARRSGAAAKSLPSAVGRN